MHTVDIWQKRLYYFDHFLGNERTVIFQINGRNRLSFGYKLVQESFRSDVPL